MVQHFIQKNFIPVSKNAIISKNKLNCCIKNNFAESSVFLSMQNFTELTVNFLNSFSVISDKPCFSNL